MIDKSESIDTYKREVIFYQSTGFQLFNQIEDKVNNVFSFQFDPYYSFVYEFILGWIYIFTIHNL
jgi:hypothetical protein